MIDLLLIVAILPIILLGKYIYNKDKNKEPNSLLIKLFISGIFSCLLTLAVTTIFSILFPFINKDPTTMNFIEFSLYVFIFIALGLFLNIKYSRCPYCHHYLSRVPLEAYCPYCGQYFSGDEH